MGLDTLNNVYSRSGTLVCKKKECFAYKEGRCTVLNNTDFGKRECPFYKTKEVRNKELAEREEGRKKYTKAG